MPNFQTSVNHNLSEQEALVRMHKFFKDARIELSHIISGAKEEWNGNVCDLKFSIFGFEISGRLIVKSPEIEFAGDIPLAALFFKDRIETIIRYQADIIFR
ncbi:MAG: polyhydroxyalkanoic acid system family protein [Candidatus Brennerbacteria bacterium]|nr:polyhydroxyalkanoic acid system family protein [Candidatus Brennerbacteria bacterium]